MTPDWREIASRIREDMKRTRLTQSDYGGPFGLSQSQISQVVRMKVSELTPALERLLLDKFGEVPAADGAGVVDDDLRGTLQLVERQIRRVLQNAPAERHARIIEHIEGQVTLLADLAAAAAGQINRPAPAPRPAPADEGPLQRGAKKATGEVRPPGKGKARQSDRKMGGSSDGQAR